MLSKVKALGNALWDSVKDVWVDDSDGCASSRRALLITSYLSTLISALSQGIVFTVMLLAIGADNVYIGSVSVVTTFCSFLQFLVPLFWERRPRRKPLLVACSVTSNVLTYVVTTLIAVLPMETSNKLVFYMIVTASIALVNAFCVPAMNAWTMQSIPFSKRVNYTSLTMLPQTILNVVTVFLVGVFMDNMETSRFSLFGLSASLSAVLILRGMSCVLIVFFDTLRALRVKEFPYEDTPSEHRNINLGVLLSPLKNKAFLMVIIIPCMWNLGASVIGEFFNLHLIENVQMKYTMISAASIISTPLYILMTPVWTLILKKVPWLKTLGFCMIGYGIAWLSNVFITEKSIWVYFFAIIWGNLFMPGISMVMNNLIYMHMPKQNRTASFSFYALLDTSCAFLGRLLGTTFVSVTAGLQWMWLGLPIGNMQLTSGIAFVIAIAASVYTLWYAGYLKRNPVKTAD